MKINKCWNKKCNKSFETLNANQKLCDPCKIKSKEKRQIYSKNKKQTQEYKNKQSIYSCIKNLQLRIDTMETYGSKCVQCGEANIFNLTIDHINNDGFKERKAVGRGVNIYKYLKNNNFPDKNIRYQILCHNCNALKEIEKRKNIILPRIYRKRDNVLTVEKAKEIGAAKLFEIILKYSNKNYKYIPK